MKPARRRTIGITAGVILLLLLVAGVWRLGRDRNQPPPAHDANTGNAVHETRALLAQTLPDLAGKAQPLRQWQDKLLVINLWATWCTPCRAEVPAFFHLQRKYVDKNVQFVGIALDTPERVEAFIAQVSNGLIDPIGPAGSVAPADPGRYPQLIGNNALIPLFARLGNVAGGVPFTVILGPGGRLLRAHQGYWKAAALEGTLAAILVESDALSGLPGHSSSQPLP